MASHMHLHCARASHGGGVVLAVVLVYPCPTGSGGQEGLWVVMKGGACREKNLLFLRQGWAFMPMVEVWVAVGRRTRV